MLFLQHNSTPQYVYSVPSGGVVDVDELVCDAVFLRQPFAECLYTVAFAGVVTTGDECGVAFAGIVCLGFGYFAGDKNVCAGGYGIFEVALRTATAPGNRPYALLWLANADGGSAQCAGNVCVQLFQCLRLTAAQPAQLLFAETLFIRGETQHPAQLGVVAQSGVCVQRQVPGIEIDVVLEQQLQAFFHPAAYGAVLTFPEEPVVDEQGIGFCLCGCFYQCQAGGYACDEILYQGLAFDLYAVGAVVLKQWALQFGVEVCFQLGVVYGHRTGGVSGVRS